jgi:hypothetical protein
MFEHIPLVLFVCELTIGLGSKGLNLLRRFAGLHVNMLFYRVCRAEDVFDFLLVLFGLELHPVASVLDAECAFPLLHKDCLALVERHLKRVLFFLPFLQLPLLLVAELLLHLDLFQLAVEGLAVLVESVNTVAIVSHDLCELQLLQLLKGRHNLNLLI